MSISRRVLLTAATHVGAAFAVASPLSALAGAPLHESPGMDLGPFYPVQKPLDTDADLTRLRGRSERAKGEIIELRGRVLTPDGKPVPHARIELWQANAAGRYSHHADDHENLPLDENFQGYALQKTDSAGQFRFLTVRPGAYPAGNFVRAPHIHLDVSGKYQRLVTQMYLPADEALLKQDRALQHDMTQQNNPLPDYIFGKLKSGASQLEKGATLCQFDIVLWAG